MVPRVTIVVALSLLFNAAASAIVEQGMIFLLSLFRYSEIWDSNPAHVKLQENFMFFY